jgi:glycine betaine/proline transport system substrate-binding protein
MITRYKGWRRFAVLALVFVVALTMTVGCSNNAGTGGNGDATGDKGTIRIGYVNWAECVAVSNLWKVLLEEQGYKVTLTQLDVAPLFTGLSQGDLDLFMDSWLPITHESYWNEYQESLEDYGVWYEPAKIGVAVPKYVTIDSLEQLKDEAGKFGGKIIGIDPGAGIMKASARAVEDYALDIEVVQGSEAAMMAELDRAYGNQEWIAITGWSPHWMFDSYDLKYLDDPKESYGEAEKLHTLAYKEFSKEHPEVAAMLKKFKMSDAEIGSLEALINEGMEPVAAAKQWIPENQAVVDSWIK